MQELLGHEDLATTQIYLHVAKGLNACGVRSPMDRLPAAGWKYGGQNDEKAE